MVPPDMVPPDMVPPDMVPPDMVPLLSVPVPVAEAEPADMVPLAEPDAVPLPLPAVAVAVPVAEAEPVKVVDEELSSPQAARRSAVEAMAMVRFMVRIRHGAAPKLGAGGGPFRPSG